MRLLKINFPLVFAMDRNNNIWLGYEWSRFDFFDLWRAQDENGPAILRPLS